jgi:hypothetical protein
MERALKSAKVILQLSAPLVLTQKFARSHNEFAMIRIYTCHLSLQMAKVMAAFLEYPALNPNDRQ